MKNKLQTSNSKIQKSIARDDAARLIDERIRVAQQTAISVALARAERYVSEWPEAWQVIHAISVGEIMDALDVEE